MGEERDKKRICVYCKILHEMMELCPSYNFRDCKDAEFQIRMMKCKTCIRHSMYRRLRITNLLLGRSMKDNWQPRGD